MIMIIMIIIILTHVDLPRRQATCGHKAIGEVAQETARGHAKNWYTVPGTRPSNIIIIFKFYGAERWYIKDP